MKQNSYAELVLALCTLTYPYGRLKNLCYFNVLLLQVHRVMRTCIETPL